MIPRKVVAHIRHLQVALSTPVSYPDGGLRFLTVMGGFSDEAEPAH